MLQDQQPIEPEIVDEGINGINKKKNTESRSKKIWSWILLIAAMIYGVSPVDLVPDAPIIGWVDDFMIGSAALMNFVQQQFFQTNNSLNKLFKIIKWILISIAILIILVAVLIITVIVKN